MPPTKVKYIPRKPGSVKKVVTKTVVTKSKPKGRSKAMGAHRKHKPQGISTLFPSQKFVQMQFVQAHGVTSSTTQNNFGTSVLYYLNTIVGPKVSAPAYNVQGYDQVATVYDKYKVFGCKVHIVFTNPSQDGLFVGVRFAQHGQIDYMDGETTSSARMKKWTTVKPMNNTGSQVWSYNRYFNIASVEGLTKLQFNADIDNYSKEFGFQPTNKPYIGVAVANTQDTTAATIAYQITCTYYVQLYDRKFLANSAYA